MHITILGATGATGRHLTEQALERGHTVVALARDPGRITLSDSTNLTTVAADVFDASSIAHAIVPGTTVISGLGVTKGAAGTLEAGARAVIDAQPDRIIWLGAYGTGASADAAGPLTRWLLRTVMGNELSDKVSADSAVIRAGGTVFHAGPLTNKALTSGWRVAGLHAVPHRPFPATISRATVAAAMLSEAETHKFPGVTVVPQKR
ncbi:NAD(P)-dependent oxidoreductase [Rhodococcus erythropolis]|uniref:NAD(P)-dependent oxidoreductase n=1 Tax=Rhodococcus erythropolis TaxID=1833 RepID=UPI002226D339|nr:NAD(P)-binding oxidoreductase [Rhodococcus erythropolis]MCW2295476.1 NAD(P)-dependent dehydrogenase (short-subunit alcohol dehydrogenase family) [Rhodococcus erythropolis]